MTAFHTDRYELTMMNAALHEGIADHGVVVEVFARSLPPGRTFGVVAGQARVVEAINQFRFSDAQCQWLVSEGIIDRAHVEYFRSFAFSGDVWGYDEGQLYFAMSPVLRVEGTLAECLALETIVLSILNHDSAVASTAAQMVRAAAGRSVLEMGSRRTHEMAAVSAARAAYLAGFSATSNLEAGARFAIATVGTASHAWTLAHRTEFESFMAQLRTQGPTTTLVVDTYDVSDGVVNAVRAAQHFGLDGPGAIRIDSGDAAEGARQARAALDDLGASETRIVVTGELDERVIARLVEEDAPIDAFGVGTRLVTGANCPSPGFVYKLVATCDPGEEWRPVAKRSAGKSNVAGRSYPYLVSGDEARARGFEINEGATCVEMVLKHEASAQEPTWQPLQRPLVEHGTLVGPVASLEDLRRDTMQRLAQVSALQSLGVVTE